jgi:HEAT repeat protein
MGESPHLGDQQSRGSSPPPATGPRSGSTGRGEPDLSAAELRGALTSAEPSRRADALARARAEPGVEPLALGALADPDPVVRRAAVLAVARLQSPRGIRALVRVARTDPSPAVRAEAVGALGRTLAIRWAPPRPPGQPT